MDFKIAVLAGDGIGPEISVQGVGAVEYGSDNSRNVSAACDIQ